MLPLLDILCVLFITEVFCLCLRLIAGQEQLTGSRDELLSLQGSVSIS